MTDRPYRQLQAFYRHNLGTFISIKPDLSDLADDWLEATVQCLRAKGLKVPPEALRRLEDRLK